MPPLLLALIVAPLAEAQDSWVLIDAGKTLPDARPALVMVTPGVQAMASLAQAEALEDQGFDAWTLELLPRGQDLQQATLAVAEGYAALAKDRSAPVVAAHGYGGVLVLLAGVQPAAMGLVAVPLAPHAVPPRVRPADGAVAEVLPWDPELLGELPMQPYSGALSRSYATWATDFPDYSPPTCPALLVASGLDAVAPPETVRMASSGWSQRSWVRAGPLNLEPVEPDHAQLLSDPALAARVARFLAQEAK